MPDLVTIAAFDREHMARRFQLLLEDEDIESVLDNEQLGAMHFLLTIATGGFKVKVRTDDSARAKQIYDIFEREQHETLSQDLLREIRFDCDECGAKIAIGVSRENGVDHCPACNCNLDVPASTEDNTFPVPPGYIFPKKLQATLPRLLNETLGAERYTNSKGWLCFEIGLVLALAWWPLLGAGARWNDLIMYQDYWDADDLYFFIAKSLIVLFGVLVIVVITSTPWKQLGIVPITPKLDLVTGCALVLMVFLISVSVPWAFDVVSQSPESIYEDEAAIDAAADTIVDEASVEDSTGPSNAGNFYGTGGSLMFLALAAILFNSFAEEIAMRVFLIPRLETLFGSGAMAVVVSAILFSSCYLHQGWQGGVGTFVVGLFFGTYYLRRRRIWPLLVSHVLYNSAIFAYHFV